jgi:hypothetical protein
VADRYDWSSRVCFGTLEDAVDFRKELNGRDCIIARTDVVRVFDDAGVFVSSKEETHKLDI